MVSKKSPASNPASSRTRHAILNLLKVDGPTDSAQLAEQLHVSAMAVRQHLYGLQAQGVVSFSEEARPLGRPAKLWHLTDAAQRHFPESYAELSVELIHAMTKAFGSVGLDKLLDVRTEEQIARYRTEISKATTLKQKLKTLARLRTAEGYMADVQPDASSGAHGRMLLIENHCPICAAAKVCEGLCRRELDAFQAVLGDAVRVERAEHIIAGARRCVYQVTPQ
jgi:predicted ArsR family transcriptional regulator